MHFAIYLKALFLGVVEGLTEFLPVSSTGHLIIADKLVGLSADQHFTDAFLIVIQLPAILAVVIYFFKDLWPFLPDRKETEQRIWLWVKIVAAFMPAAVVGFLLHDKIEAVLFKPVPVAIAFIVGGIVILLLERRKREGGAPTARDITLKLALGIGAMQCLALIPGTSRSGATIIGAMALGASRLAAAEFSFFLAIPTMVGATALTMIKHFPSLTREEWLVLGAGCLTSFVVAYAVVAGLMTYIRRHDFKPFGWYRIAAGALVLAYVLAWSGGK